MDWLSGPKLISQVGLIDSKTPTASGGEKAGFQASAPYSRPQAPWGLGLGLAVPVDTAGIYGGSAVVVRGHIRFSLNALKSEQSLSREAGKALSVLRS